MLSNHHNNGIRTSGSSDREHQGIDLPKTITGTNDQSNTEHSGLVRAPMGENPEIPQPNRTRRLYFLCLCAGALLVYQLLDALMMQQAKAKHREQIEDARKAQRTTERDAIFKELLPPSDIPEEEGVYEYKNEPIWAKK